MIARHDSRRRSRGIPITFAKPRWESGRTARARARRLRRGVGAVRVNRHIDRDCIDRTDGRTDGGPRLSCRTKWNTHCAGKVVALRYFQDCDDPDDVVDGQEREGRGKDGRTDEDRHAGFVFWGAGVTDLSDRSGHCLASFIIIILYLPS